MLYKLIFQIKNLVEMDDQNQLLILERFTMRKHYIVRRKLYGNLRSKENAVSKKKEIDIQMKVCKT